MASSWSVGCGISLCAWLTGSAGPFGVAASWFSMFCLGWLGFPARPFGGLLAFGVLRLIYIRLECMGLVER